MTRPWSLTTEPGAPVRIRVDLGQATATTERDALLSDGIVELVDELVAAAAGPDPVVVDIRCPGGDPASLRAVEAYLAAARGLVQSFVLERVAPAGPVNLVISDTGQIADREATWDYLGSADGGFSWGACYDLREDLR